MFVFIKKLQVWLKQKYKGKGNTTEPERNPDPAPTPVPIPEEEKAPKRHRRFIKRKKWQKIQNKKKATSRPTVVERSKSSNT